MVERIEELREKLHKAIENGDSDEILQASMDLDIEIANIMATIYQPGESIFKANEELCLEERSTEV